MADDKPKNLGTIPEGVADEVKGRVTDAAGGLTGDPGLQAEGKIAPLFGMAQQ